MEHSEERGAASRNSRNCDYYNKEDEWTPPPNDQSGEQYSPSAPPESFIDLTDNGDESALVPQEDADDEPKPQISLESRIQALLMSNAGGGIGFLSPCTPGADEDQDPDRTSDHCGRPPLPDLSGPPLPDDPPPPLPPQDSPPLPPPPPTPTDAPPFPPDVTSNGYVQYDHIAQIIANLESEEEVESEVARGGGDDDDRMSLSSLSDGEEKLEVINTRVAPPWPSLNFGGIEGLGVNWGVGGRGGFGGTGGPYWGCGGNGVPLQFQYEEEEQIIEVEIPLTEEEQMERTRFKSTLDEVRTHQ